MKPDRSELYAGLAIILLYVIMSALWLLGVLSADDGQRACEIDAPMEQAHCRGQNGQ